MTPSEFKKLEAAVMCMKGISLVETEVNLEGFHIHQQSVIYLLSSFVEEEKLENTGFCKVVEPFNLGYIRGYDRNHRGKDRKVQSNPDNEEEPSFEGYSKNES